MSDHYARLAEERPQPASDANDGQDPPARWRTLADIDDTPPAPLLLGMLEPDGPNLMYASGGTGKGTTAAWMIGELLLSGVASMIYDAENRPREWARRTSGLGIDQRRVVYLQPRELPRGMAGRPMWDIAPHLGLVARAAGVGVLFIDSVLPAIGVGEERLKSDAQSPYLYVAALDELGLTSVSLGHPPKGQPEGDPFGSVAWVNAMRLTWLGSQAEGDQHRVRWRPRKRNERGHIAGVLFTFEYGDDGRLCGATVMNDEESTRDWIMAALVAGPRSMADMAEEVWSETDGASSGELDRIKERLGRMLRRMARDGAVSKDGGKGGPNVRWSLRWETK